MAPIETRAFSLLELITVLVIVLVVAAMAWPSLLGTIEAARSTRTLGQLCMALERARQTALAENTYVWLGFAEAQGLLVSTVASKDGSRIFNPNASASAGNRLDAARVVQVGKLLSLEGMRLADVAEPSGAGSPFDCRPSVRRGPVVYRIGASTPAPSRFPFQYPVGAPAPPPQHLFTKTVQFNARGEALVNGSYSNVPWLEIAMEPARPAAGRQMVLQVAGLTGQIQMYRR